MLFGTKSGRDCDKIAEANCEVQPASQIDSILLSDAVASFECELDGEIEAGDHYIFTGRVVCSHVNETPQKRLYTVGKGYKLGCFAEADL